MRDRVEEFGARNAKVVAIGMGSANKAAEFARRFEVPFLLLADPRRESYKAMGLRRGSLNEIAGPKVWAKGAKSILGGSPTTLTKQDMKQLGGVAIVLPDGTITYEHRASTSADNPPLDELLAALP